MSFSQQQKKVETLWPLLHRRPSTDSIARVTYLFLFPFLWLTRPSMIIIWCFDIFQFHSCTFGYLCRFAVVRSQVRSVSVCIALVGSESDGVGRRAPAHLYLHADRMQSIAAVTLLCVFQCLALSSIKEKKKHFLGPSPLYLCTVFVVRGRALNILV